MPRTGGLLPLIAIVFCIVALGDPSRARAAGCDAYDTVLQFQYTAKNFEGVHTTGCVGFDAASVAAGSGSMYYQDTYCGGRSATTKFRVVGSRLRLTEFLYPGCNGKGKENIADITLAGFQSAASACFTELTFYWKYQNGGGDTSKAKATSDSLCSSS